MGQKTGSSLWWIVAGVGALVAAVSGHGSDKATPAQAATFTAPTAPSAQPPVALSNGELLARAKGLLLLTHSGKFRSRDLHSRALAALDQIRPEASEQQEAQQLRRGVNAAYLASKAAPPAADGSALPDDIRDAMNAAMTRQAIAEQAAPASELATKPQPVAGFGYGAVSSGYGSGAKTVHVNGYYRKNGTYVHEHYRSKRH